MYGLGFLFCDLPIIYISNGWVKRKVKVLSLLLGLVTIDRYVFKAVVETGCTMTYLNIHGL